VATEEFPTRSSTTTLGVDECRAEPEIADHAATAVAIVYEAQDGYKQKFMGLELRP
jgi:hypothetical protein